MKAWKWYDFGDMRLEEEPIPEAKSGWVVAKVRVVQASVTDAQRAMGISTGGIEIIRKLIEKNAPIKLFGHELCAHVMEIGDDVTGFKVGDRISARSTMPCHQCNVCLTGYPERCRRGYILGREIPGGFAEYVALPAEILARLPDSISDNEGATIQPSSASVIAVATASIEMGDTVVVLGQGCMGNYIMQIARCSGAGRVITTDIRDEALELSKRLGADYVIDARNDDPKKIVMEITDGIGADIVFDTAGGAPRAGLSGTKTISTSFEIVRDEGKVVQVAHLGLQATLDIEHLRNKGVKYIMPRLVSQRLFQHTVNLVATKRLQTEPLITVVLEGLEKVPQAIEMTLNKAKYKMMNPAQVVISQD